MLILQPSCITAVILGREAADVFVVLCGFVFRRHNVWLSRQRSLPQPLVFNDMSWSAQYRQQRGTGLFQNETESHLRLLFPPPPPPRFDSKERQLSPRVTLKVICTVEQCFLTPFLVLQILPLSVGVFLFLQKWQKRVCDENSPRTFECTAFPPPPSFQLQSLKSRPSELGFRQMRQSRERWATVRVSVCVCRCVWARGGNFCPLTHRVDWLQAVQHDSTHKADTSIHKTSAVAKPPHPASFANKNIQIHFHKEAVFLETEWNNDKLTEKWTAQFLTV